MKVKRTFDSILNLTETIPLMVVGIPFTQSVRDARCGEFEYKLLEYISDKFFFEENFLVAIITNTSQLKKELISKILIDKYKWAKFETSDDTIQYKTNIINFFSPDEEFSLVVNNDYDYLIQFEDIQDFNTFDVLSTISKKKIITTLDEADSIYYQTDDTYRQIYVSDNYLAINNYLQKEQTLLANEERYRRGDFNGIVNDRF